MRLQKLSRLEKRLFQKTEEMLKKERKKGEKTVKLEKNSIDEMSILRSSTNLIEKFTKKRISSSS